MSAAIPSVVKGIARPGRRIVRIRVFSSHAKAKTYAARLSLLARGDRPLWHKVWAEPSNKLKALEARRRLRRMKAANMQNIGIVQ